MSTAFNEAIKRIVRQEPKENCQNEYERKKIYNSFIEANYDMGPYDKFVSDIKDPIKRKKLYDAAVDEGFKVGTFQSFSAKLGFND